MKYRVFKNNIGWSEGIYLFPEEITFQQIKENLSTKHLTKDNYVGCYEFENKFLSIFEYKKTNIEYYVRFCYQVDALPKEVK